LNIFYPPDNRR